MSEDPNYQPTPKHYTKKRNKRRGIFFPLLMVTVGIYLLYNNFGNPQGTSLEALLQLWPLLLIVGGLDGIITGDGFISSIIIMGLGSFFLLKNFGYLQSNDFWSLIRFWPVILIAIGLDLIVGRRSIWSAIIGIILGICLLAGVAWLAINPVYTDFNLQNETRTLRQNLQASSAADIDIERLTGFIDITGKSEPALLIESKVILNKGEYLDEDFYQVKKNAFYTLSDTNNFFPGVFNFHPSKTWNIQLNPKIPLTLNFELIMGEMNLDLSQLNIEHISSELILGRTVLTLPEGNYQGDISTPVGEVIIYVPDDVDVRIQADTALTTIYYPETYSKYEETISSDASLHRKGTVAIDLTVEVPVGNLVIMTY